jgi:hypothetical protein
VIFSELDIMYGSPEDYYESLDIVIWILTILMYTFLSEIKNLSYSIKHCVLVVFLIKIYWI